MQAPARACGWCSKKGAPKRCPCKAESYCGPDCQKSAWFTHRSLCSIYRSNAIVTQCTNLGNDAEAVGLAHRGLGNLFLQQGRLEDALVSYREAERIYRLCFGEGAAVGDILHHVCALYSAQGKYSEALQQYKQAKTITKQGGYTMANLLNSCGVTQMLSGEIDEAAEKFQQSHDIHLAIGGPTTQVAASVLLNLGAVQLNRGLLDTARDHLDQAISLFKRARGEDVGWNRQNDDIGVSSALLCMAQISIQQHRLQEAMDRINNALDLIRRVNGEKSCKAATALCQVGRIYQKQGHLDESFKMFRRALLYRQWTLGCQHAHVATSMVLVAGVHIIRREFDNALVLLKGAAGIQQAAFGDYHSSLENTYLDMAQCWEGLEDTTNECAIMEKLQELYAALGRTADADEVATMLAAFKK